MLEQALSDAMRVVQTNVMQIVAEVALERGANIVLAKHQVLIFDRTLDVTQTVLDRLNRRLPDVPVNDGVNHPADRRRLDGQEG